MRLPSRRNLVRFAAFGSALTLCSYSAYKSRSYLFRAATSGALGALFVEFIFHPVDTLNMRAKAGNRGAPQTFFRLDYANMVDKFRGVGYVYYCYPLPLFIYYGIYYWARETCRHLAIDEGLSSAMAATISESVFILVMYPFELFKTRAQAAFVGEKPASMWEVYSKSSRWKGRIGNFYIGIVPYFITYVAYVAFQFGIYHFVVHTTMKRQARTRPSFALIFGASAAAGALASCLTNPLETWAVVRQTGGRVALNEFLSWEFVKRGIVQRVIYNVSVSATLFFALEHFSSLFGVQFSQ